MGGNSRQHEKCGLLQIAAVADYCRLPQLPTIADCRSCRLLWIAAVEGIEKGTDY
ncbi:MAG: hypothetical protein ACKVTZ_14200 [Bacteroidia bacterium]